jgi:4-hydroxybenzoate polyprenyltransferase
VTVRQAVFFMLALCLAGLVVLAQFNPFAIALGASSLLLVVVYPFAKRVTYWPQAVLGLTFNWGALLGWATVRGDLGWPAVVLYAGGLLWTLGYDTIYAHQDKEDDILIDVKSTALKLGAATKPWLGIFYAGSIGLLALAGAMVGIGWPCYAVLVLVAAHFAWQVSRLDLNDPKDCLAKFKSNQTVGLMIFAAIVLGRVVG